MEGLLRKQSVIFAADTATLTPTHSRQREREEGLKLIPWYIKHVESQPLNAPQKQLSFRAAMVRMPSTFFQ